MYQISAETDNFHFLDQTCPKRVFRIKILKSEHRHWILRIRISPDTKFQNKLTILIILTRFTQRGNLRSKSKKVNITTEFCIFKLEENNDIFLASSDALVYLAKSMHKKCSTILVGATHLLRILWPMLKYVCNLGITLRFFKAILSKGFCKTFMWGVSSTFAK